MPRVRIAPKPGFVIKSTTTASGFYTPTPTNPVPVAPAHKVFFNIAYDTAIPAPPDVDIPQAIKEGTYLVPLVVSDGRPDSDKAGKPALVFDAILNPSLKPRLLKDPDFRAFVIELVLTHIESPPTTDDEPPKRALTLSRTLATPNIRVKGTLEPREINVPDFSASELTKEPVVKKPPLIEELPPKSILKKPAPPMEDADPHICTPADAQCAVPEWRWDPPHDKLVVELPGFTHTDHARAALLASQEILTLRAHPWFLQVPLGTAVVSDVERVRAEWRVKEGTLVVFMHAVGKVVPI